MRRPRAHAARSSQAVAEMGRISARLIARAASPGRALGILDREWERPIRRICHLHPLIAGVEAQRSQSGPRLYGPRSATIETRRQPAPRRGCEPRGADIAGSPPMPPEPYPYKPDPATGKQRAEILRLIGGRWDFPDGFSAREARELIYSLRQGAKQPKPEQWVYFIQAGSEGPIKIGIADSPALRLRELQTGNHLPLTLLKAVPGGKDLE